MGMYKKQYPGIYSDREKRLLDEARARLAKQKGQASPMGGGVANETIMLLYANAWDPWNPLYNDKDYAKNTKYGDVISLP